MSIRTYLFLVLIVGGVVAIGSRRQWAFKQVEASVDKVHGTISFGDDRCICWVDRFVVGPSISEIKVGMYSEFGGGLVFRESTLFDDSDLRRVCEYDGGVKFLDLSNTSVTENGIRRLSRLSHLEVLILDNTKVGDTCIGALSDIQTLSYVQLRGSRCTSRGIVALERALPNCKVE